MTTSTIGDIVYYDCSGTKQIKPDGTNVRLALPDEYGDPSNQSFAGGARWYLVVRVTERLPRFENRQIVDFVDIQNIFAVNSITGDEIQVTDFAGSYLWIQSLKCSWSRDTCDQLITFAAQDEHEYATVVGGQIGYDFGIGFKNYALLGTHLLAINTSSRDIDAAYHSGQSFTPTTRRGVASVTVDEATDTTDFTISPSGLLGAYGHGVCGPVCVVETFTGKKVLELEAGSRDASWTPGNNLLYSTQDGIGICEFANRRRSLITKEAKRDQEVLSDPKASPDGSYIAYKAQVSPEGSRCESRIFVVHADGTGRTQVGDRVVDVIRWVAD
ncbi:hypothetical protein NG895_04345 [Aeoliella sp. ICT_H6.2]|uniref:WD40-like Beta Propeller Repeat n=1 Tax=Aeoliella straminimaris TaxID=2954799 RepID=A0A9X2FFH3_9BACT|nr:hypothetical protein [Aeoliella straminimaris]MCO6043126.1 hypothetical protein [Aeoliella straminimaris]